MYVLLLQSATVSELPQRVLEQDSSFVPGKNKQGTHRPTNAQCILNVIHFLFLDLLLLINHPPGPDYVGFSTRKFSDGVLT